MTELERQEFRKALSEIKPIPGFDSEKWLRKVRAKIRRETEGMTAEEEREYYRKGSEELQEKLKCRRAELVAENQT
jgi:hypothetical protein